MCSAVGNAGGCRAAELVTEEAPTVVPAVRRLPVWRRPISSHDRQEDRRRNVEEKRVKVGVHPERMCCVVRQVH